MIRPGTIPTLALLVALSACGGRDGLVLAEVGDRSVTWAEYREAYIDYLVTTGLPDEATRRTGFLERMISMELVRLDAAGHGLAEGAEWEDARERARRRLLVDAWLAGAAWDTLVVDETELRELFVRANTEIKARHLYAPTRDEADRLAARLEAGERFEDLARETFSDPALAGSGGSLGTFGFDEMDPAFEEVAFSLEPGQTSPPVRTAQGWSIIRVDDRFTKPILTEAEFAARRPMLSAYVLDRERKLSRSRLLDQALAEASPRIDPDVADHVLLLLGTGTSGSERGQVAAEAVLFRYDDGEGGQTWTVGDFLSAARYTDPAQRRAVRDRPTFEAFATGLLVRDLMMRRSREAGLDRSDRFAHAYEAAMDEWLYERGFERMAASEPLAEDSLRAWFDEHAREVFLPERVYVREIVTARRETADSIRAALGSASFAELAARHSIRASSAGSGGELGLLSRGDLGPLADRVFSAPEGAVVGPVPVPGLFVLLEVGRREPPRPATFDEARRQVEAVFRLDRRDRLVAERAAALRDRYPVRYRDVDLAALPLLTEPVPSS